MVARGSTQGLEKMGHVTFLEGATRWEELMGEAFTWCRKVFWLCAAKTGSKSDESMQAGDDGHERVWKDVETSRNTRTGEGPCQECERVGSFQGKKVTRKECKRLREEVSWRKKSCGTSPKRQFGKTEEPCQEMSESCSVNTKPCTKKTFSAVGCGRRCGR